MITVNKDSVTVEAVNLDGFIDPADLQSLRAQAKELAKQLQHIATYCEAKATAMESRLKGEIQVAARFELVCEEVYSRRLPTWAKW